MSHPGEQLQKNEKKIKTKFNKVFSCIKQNVVFLDKRDAETVKISIICVLPLIKRSDTQIDSFSYSIKKNHIFGKKFLKGKRVTEQYKTSKKALTVEKKTGKKVFFVAFTHSLSPWCFIRRTKPG